MTRDWTNVENAVAEYIESIDEYNMRERYVLADYIEPRFKLNRMEIVPDGDALRISAYDESGRLYKYSAFVRGGRIEWDGV